MKIIASNLITYDKVYGYFGFLEIVEIKGKILKVHANFNHGVIEVVGSYWSTTAGHWAEVYRIHESNVTTVKNVRKYNSAVSANPTRKDFEKDLDDVFDIMKKIVFA